MGVLKKQLEALGARAEGAQGKGHEHRTPRGESPGGREMGRSVRRPEAGA